MKLSVPFIPKPAYADFLAACRESLASVYFPLNTPERWDARVGTGGMYSKGVMTLGRALAPLKGVKKYVLINTRFVLPDIYTDSEKIISFLDTLARLADIVPVRGIVFSDFYLIRAMDRTGHTIIRDLEAVPGVNCMMDTFGKVRANLEMLATTRFRPPSRLIVDRSLNRDIERLSAIGQNIRKAYPGMELELLANEGCILNCPFKPAHDAQISLSNTGLVKEATFKINRHAGCHDYFAHHPERILQSPFIRPEDLGHYRHLADAVKISGRTLGPDFLTRCIRAYDNRSFSGNLLDLMDATHFLADYFHIDNKALGKDFFLRLSSCTNQCKTCNMCDRLFQNTAQKKSTTFRQYKDI